jgi:large subunit ribosomal protein L15
VDILSKLQAPVGAVTKATRVGRGPGSGLGKTSGRGQKGQKARSTGNINKKHFQGGQTPIQRRLPKRGFRNVHASPVLEVNVGDLEVFDAGATVDVVALHATRLIHGKLDAIQKALKSGELSIKVLGDGDLTKKLTISASKFSKSAAEKISAAGGSMVELPKPVRPDHMRKSKAERRAAGKTKSA